jgi:hypothetical protein
MTDIFTFNYKEAMENVIIKDYGTRDALLGVIIDNK